MTIRLIGLVAVILCFGLLSTFALMDAGYVGIITMHFRSWGGAQVFADLVILAILACRWMRRDAPAHGLPAWPFIAITLVAGSFGPLIYLAVREMQSEKVGRLSLALN